MAAAVFAQTPRRAIKSPRSDDGAGSHRMGYFDKYPARATPGKPLDDDDEDGDRFSPSAPASLNGHGPAPRKTRSQRSGSAVTDMQTEAEKMKIAWPSKPEEIDIPSRTSSPEPDLISPKLVNASTSSFKSRARNSVASTLPELRHSASSTVDHDRLSYSPPQTPVGTYPPHLPGDNVMVAAPVPGVEMMDALVDGMNGLAEHSSSDDYRMASRSRRHGARKRIASIEKRHPGLHPSNTPPLPKPPHGVKLGAPPTSRGEGHTSPSSRQRDDAEEPAAHRPPRSSRPRVRSSTTSNAKTPPSPTSATDPSVRRGRSSSQLGKSQSSTQLAKSQSNTTSSSDSHRSNKNPTIDQIIKDMASQNNERLIPKSSRPSQAPSIADIIRTHAPEYAKAMPMPPPRRPATSPALPTSHEETENDEDPGGRSSIDSVTHEVQSTLQRTTNHSTTLHHARSFPNRPIGTSSAPPTTFGGLRSLRVSESEHEFPLEAPRYAQSVYSASSYGVENTGSVFSSSFFSPPPPDSAMAIAQYLRSPRLTKLLTLRRPPHRGLTVSLADVGNPNGKPVLVFLGLGCVRYLIALYDEMAEALGLRLIAVDRWGMGRTGDVPQEQRGLKEWAAVCEEVIDTLGIRTCGVLAHSAGAPYALAFALRVHQRVTGSIHLLAPWVGGGIDVAGYKWLKYVPNSFIKAAQNAEWKVHGWKLGKPPTIVYEGIGFDPNAPVSATVTPASSSNGLLPLTAESLKGMESTPPSTAQSSLSKKDDTRLGVPRSSMTVPRTSMGAWSDYDDLADFDGKFGSQTTLPLAPPVPPLPNGVQNSAATKRKVSDRLFGILKSPNTTPNTSSSKSHPPSPLSESHTPAKPAAKLKGLRSISSLKGKLSGQRSSNSAKPATPKLEANTDSFGTGLGIDMQFKPEQDNRSKEGIEAWASACSAMSPESRPTSPISVESHTFTRPRRSISLTASSAPTQVPSTPLPSMGRAKSTPIPRPLSGDSTYSFKSQPKTPRPGGATMNAPTSSVATALLRASHKEAQRGLANDLLSILERDAKPWGFHYADVKQRVKIWYGDRDEKISEGGIRWMERVMKDCELKICKGRDHSLMTCAPVVVEALESLQSELRFDDRPYP